MWRLSRMFRTYSALVYYVLTIFSREINRYTKSLSRLCFLNYGLASLIELHSPGFGELCPKIFI